MCFIGLVFGDVVEDDGGFTVYGGELDFEGFVAVGAVVDVFFGLGEFFATIDTVHSWVPFSFALFDISNKANKYRVSCLMKIQRKEDTATKINVAQILATVFLRGYLTVK